MAKLEIRRLNPKLGAEVYGVDLSKELDSTTLDQIQQALLDHLVIFFPDQSKMTPEQHIAFAKHFGEIDIHPFIPKLEGHDEIVVLDSDTYGRADTWHTDVTFQEKPPMGSILHTQILPEVGGDTMWLNLYSAYHALSKNMKKFLEGLTAVHDFASTFGLALQQTPEGRAKMDEVRKNNPPAEHPVVRTHPKTGRKCLFVNRTFTSYLKGLHLDEGQAILNFLYDHTEQPEFMLRRSWKVGDVGFWDNRCTMHYAIFDYKGHRRRIHRVTIKGDKPF